VKLKGLEILEEPGVYVRDKIEQKSCGTLCGKKSIGRL
jgi:hypothetical protein